MSELAQRVYDRVIKTTFNDVDEIARIFGYKDHSDIPDDAYMPISRGKYSTPEAVRNAINSLDQNRPKEKEHFTAVKNNINDHVGDNYRVKVYDIVEDISFSKGTMTVHVTGKAYGDSYSYERTYSPNSVDYNDKGLKYIAFRAKQAGIRVGHKVKSIRIIGLKD